MDHTAGADAHRGKRHRRRVSASHGDQARGGGGCGCVRHSGGVSVAADRRIAEATSRQSTGSTLKSNTLKIFNGQSSGGQTPLVSQHGQSFLLPCIAGSQSAMSMA